MGWFSKESDKSEAEKSLEALQSGLDVPTTAPSPPAEAGYGDEEDGQDIFLTLRETPATRTPGTRLRVRNEGTLIRNGTPVLLQNTFSEHPTRIVAMYRDGRPVKALDEGAEGEVVLEGSLDLGEVYRVSCLAPLEEAGTSSYAFQLLVHSAEQRGRDAYVVGPAKGTVRQRATVIVSPWDDPRDRFSRVLAVERLLDGRTALLLGGRDASTMQLGDDVALIKGVTD